MSIVVELPLEMERDLDALATRAGSSRKDYLRRLILDHIEDAEDYREARAVVERIDRGEESTSSLDEVSRRLGLDD